MHLLGTVSRGRTESLGALAEEMLLREYEGHTLFTETLRVMSEALTAHKDASPYRPPPRAGSAPGWGTGRGSRGSSGASPSTTSGAWPEIHKPSSMCRRGWTS